MSLHEHGDHVVAIRRRTAEPMATIVDMTERIVRDFHPLRVMLFGSQARGDADDKSDIDLLVVMPDGTDRRKAMVAMLSALNEFREPADVVVTTPDEIARRGKLIGTVLRTALSEGKALYERG